MDACCNDIIGGEIIINATFPQGRNVTYEGMGDVRIQPSMMERTAGASSGGSLWVTEAPRPARALLNFANRCDFNPLDLFKGRCAMDIIVIEKGRGVQHEFAGAILVGLPEINLSNGEFTGMEVASTQYSSGSYSDTGAASGAAGQRSGQLSSLVA